MYRKVWKFLFVLLAVLALHLSYHHLKPSSGRHVGNERVLSVSTQQSSALAAGSISRPDGRRPLSKRKYPGKSQKVYEASTPDGAEVDSAVQECQSMLQYGGMLADSAMTEECVSYVLEYPSAWKELFEKIKSYLIWHNSTRNQIQQSLDEDKSVKEAVAGVRTLTYRCMKWPHCAGYGDQTQKTVRGFLLAMLSKRFFTVDWSPNFKKSDSWVEVFTPTVLNWKLNPSLSLELITPKFCTTCKFTKSSVAVIDAYSVQRSTNHLFHYALDASKILCGKQTNVEGQMQIDMDQNHIKYFCKEARRDHYVQLPARMFFVYGIIHRLLYQFSQPIVERGEGRLKGMGLQHSPFVAVHIRTALEETTAVKMNFYLRVGRFQRDESHWEEFINCGKMAANGKGVKSPLLLFSDSSDCLKWAAEKYPLNEVIPSNASFWHNAEHGSRTKESEESVDKIIDTMSDLYLISKAAAVVKGVSLFSNLGIYLGAISNNNILRCDLMSKKTA